MPFCDIRNMSPMEKIDHQIDHTNIAIEQNMDCASQVGSRHQWGPRGQAARSLYHRRLQEALFQLNALIAEREAILEKIVDDAASQSHD